MNDTEFNEKVKRIFDIDITITCTLFISSILVAITAVVLKYGGYDTFSAIVGSGLLFVIGLIMLATSLYTLRYLKHMSEEDDDDGI